MLKRDELGRVVPFCLHSDDSVVEMIPLADLPWDNWKCPECNVMWPVFQVRDRIEREARIHEDRSEVPVQRGRM